VAEAERPVEPEAIDGGEDIGGEAVPVEVVQRWGVAQPVGPFVEGVGVEGMGEVSGQGSEDGGAEAGGVGQEEWGSVAGQVIGGNAYAVGRGEVVGGDERS
jgi:hypothetical protein